MDKGEETRTNGSEDRIDTEHLNVQEAEIGRLFYLSFRFSQGDQGRQEKILYWVYLNGFIKKSQISTPSIPNYFSGKFDIPVKHTDAGFMSGATEMWRTLYEIVQKPEITKRKYKLTSNDALNDALMLDLLSGDLAYQSQLRPGRTVSKDTIPDSLNDPHASLVRKYVLNGQNSGHAAYNQMCNELREVLIKNRQPREIESITKELDTASSIPELAETFRSIGVDPSTRVIPPNSIPVCISLLKNNWERNHPGQSFFSEG